MGKKSKRERREEKRRTKSRKKNLRAPNRGPGLEFSLYCDEAGNTGINYVDVDQPIHVLAGWLVPKKNEDSWTSSIQGIRSLHGSLELHGVRLLSSKKGIQVAVDILETGLKHGAFPISMIAYKDHCLSLRAVEIFMDPSTNPAAKWLPPGADVLRKDIATLLCDVAGDEVRAFGPHLKVPDVVEWGNVVDQLSKRTIGISAGHADSKLLRTISETLDAVSSPSVIQDIVDAEKTRGWGTGKRYESVGLNFPVFMNFIRIADTILNGHVCDVIHDITLQFEAALGQGFEALSKPGMIDVRTEDGSLARLSVGSFRSFKTEDSKSLPALQAADILASSIYRVGKAIYMGKKLDDNERKLAALSLGHVTPMVIDGTLRRAPGIGSDEQVLALYSHAYAAFKEYYEQSIGKRT